MHVNIWFICDKLKLVFLLRKFTFNNAMCMKCCFSSLPVHLVIDFMEAPCEIFWLDSYLYHIHTDTVIPALSKPD